jgi:hypothetical protein
MYRKDNNGRVGLVFGGKELREVFGGDVEGFDDLQSIDMLEAARGVPFVALQPKNGTRRPRHVSETEDYSEEYEYKSYLYESSQN